MLVADKDKFSEVINEERIKNGGESISLNFGCETVNFYDSLYDQDLWDDEEEKLIKIFESYEDIKSYYPRFEEDFRKKNNIDQSVPDSYILSEYYGLLTQDGKKTNFLLPDGTRWMSRIRSRREDLRFKTPYLKDIESFKKIHMVGKTLTDANNKTEFAVNYLLTDAKLAKHYAEMLNRQHRAEGERYEILSVKALMNGEMTNGAGKTNG